ncbi:MAG: sugar phosphate isomerase/epimerase [Kiritimatiellae bacterium]|nr:sugar phosphate isomerase/epimerase [Kiritimatiellia bacterium]
MKFSVCNEFYEGWKLTDVFAHAAKLGYDGVEVAHFTFCDSVTDVSKAERERLKKAAADAGVEVVGVHWILVSPKGLHINHPDKAVRDRTREYFHALIDFCGDLGGRVIVIGSPKNRNVVAPLTPEQAWAYARETFSACCDHAAERDVRLCIEPLGSGQTDFINRPADGARLVEEIGHPNFRLILDVYSMSCEQVDIPRALIEHAPHLAHFHANDDNKRWPGSGGADYPGIARALAQIGYPGYASVEVFDFKPDPETIAREAIGFLKSVF